MIFTSGDFQTDRIDELIKREGHSAIEFVELTCFGVHEAAVIVERLENGAGKRCVEFFEKLQINDADAIAVGGQAIAAEFGEPLDEAFRAQFGKIVAQGAESVFGSRAAEGCGSVAVDFSRGEAVLSGDVREADQGMHQGELSGMIEFKPRNAFAVGKDRRLNQSL